MDNDSNINDPMDRETQIRADLIRELSQRFPNMSTSWTTVEPATRSQARATLRAIGIPEDQIVAALGVDGDYLAGQLSLSMHLVDDPTSHRS